MVVAKLQEVLKDIGIAVSDDKGINFVELDNQFCTWCLPFAKDWCRQSLFIT
jgi:hypothetical protein